MLTVVVCLILDLIVGDLVPGLEFTASGYNIYFANPYVAGAVDPGYKEQISDTSSFSQNQKVGDYQVPDGWHVIPSKNCAKSFADVTISGTHSYQQTYSESVSVSADYLVVAFSMSENFQSCYKYTEDGSLAVMWSWARSTAYASNLIAPYGYPNFTSNFAQTVLNMPTQFNDSTSDFFYKFITSYFGTHYIASSSLGGLFAEYSVMTRDAYSSYSSSNLSISDSCNAFTEICAGMSSTSSFDQQEANYFYGMLKTNETISIGADFPSSGLSSWCDGIPSTAMPIQITLEPLSNLLTSEFFPEDSQISQKQSAYSQALDKYCAYLQSDYPSKVIDCNGYPPDQPTPPSSIFGGVYMTKSSYVNPYTNVQSCPLGFQKYSFFNNGYDGSELYFCLNETQVAAGKDELNAFGGGYYLDSSGGCSLPNPLTKECNCPSGYNSEMTLEWKDKSTDYYRSYFCYLPDPPTNINTQIMGGFFQTGVLSVPNYYTGSECYTGYKKFILTTTMTCDGHGDQHCTIYVCLSNIHVIN